MYMFIHKDTHHWTGPVLGYTWPLVTVSLQLYRLLAESTGWGRRAQWIRIAFR